MAQALKHRHNQTVLNSLEEGDLVEFPRGIYSHWAVYIGNEEVVHLAGDTNAESGVNSNPTHLFSICGEEFAKAKVTRDNFFKVAADSEAKKNNDKDKKVSPSDKKLIVERAKSKIGEIGYNVLWKNCEYFASWCRYGEGWSEQAINFLIAAGLIAAGAIVIGAIVYGASKAKKVVEIVQKPKQYILTVCIGLSQIIYLPIPLRT